MDFQLLIKNYLPFQYIKWIYMATVTIILLNWLHRLIFQKFVHLNKPQTNFIVENIYKDGDNISNEYTPALDKVDHIRYKGATIKLKGGAEEFFQMVQNRRSVRFFKPHPIPSINLIKTCIRASGTSPSGAHTEPWTFCVISSTEVKRSIRKIVEVEEELNYTKRMSRQWTTDLLPLKTTFIKPYLTDAPYIIIIFKQTYGFTKSGKRKQHYYNDISVSIATGILLCALQSAGISSLVTTPLNCGSKLRNLLNRPINEKLLVLLPVGYAADNCTVPDLKRKSLNDIMVMV